MDTRYTSFDGSRLLARGCLPQMALAVKAAQERGAAGPVLIFDDDTGRSIDVDTRGPVDEVLARLTPMPATETRPRGRPRLGVVAREVTLLPRHWEWLGAQPGGASVALRKLVEQARRDGSGEHDRRRSQERAYHFMAAMAGDVPGFEEATRALFAPDPARFAALMAAWPADVRAHALQLANLSPPASS